MLARHHLVPRLQPQIEDVFALPDVRQPMLRLVWVRLRLLLLLRVLLPQLCVLAYPVQRCEPETPLAGLGAAAAIIFDVIHRH